MKNSENSIAFIGQWRRGRGRGRGGFGFGFRFGGRGWGERGRGAFLLAGHSFFLILAVNGQRGWEFFSIERFKGKKNNKW